MISKVRLVASIFDMDGVITDTAELHFKSWQITFNAFLKSVSDQYQVPYVEFSKMDYLLYVDGVMRSDGVKQFLLARNLLPKSHHAECSLVLDIGHAKDKCFLEMIEMQGVKCFASTINLIKQLRDRGILLAAISSSRHCHEILTKANIFNCFDVIVDGKMLEKLKIPGKPDPGIFLEAAKMLQANPKNCMVVEDALSGVKAGCKGGFKLVVGIDRNGIGRQKYLDCGANLVVNDLAELTVVKLKQWFNFDVNAGL